MKITIDLPEETLRHCLKEVLDHTDECYTPGVPFPPSSEWAAFQEAFKESFELNQTEE